MDKSTYRYEFAILRFRALFGTESFDEVTFAAKCQQCIFGSFNKERSFFETVKKIKILPENPTQIDYVSIKLPGQRRALNFDIGFQPIGYSNDQVRYFRIVVAAQMDDSVTSSNKSKEFCENNGLIIINNLFSFAQMGYDESQGCAETDIINFLKANLKSYGN